MKILIIGSKGRLGKTLMNIFPEATGIDIGDNILEEELEKAGITFLAVPLKVTLDIINKHTDYRTFVDLTSVKSPMKKYSGKIISIHPMFGPSSYKTNKDILFINDISSVNSIKTVSGLFEKYNIIPLTADQHDNLMGELLVKPYILSYICDGKQSPIETSSHKKLLELLSIKDDENQEIMLDTIILNCNTRKIIDEMQERLDYLKKLIGNR